MFLLADIQHLIGIVVALLAFVVWIFNQIAEGNKQRPAPPRRPAPRRPQPQGAPPNQADPLRQEVEQFLRRASGEAEAAAPRPPRHRPARARPTIEVLVEDDPAALQAEVIQPPAAGPRQPLQRQTLQPPASQLTPTRQTVAEHTTHAIGARSFARRESHLGERVALADDKLVSHLRTTFEHELGRLVDTHSDDAYRLRTSENVAAGQIAAMLANPEGVRQAVVLNEILQRPVDHWE